MVDFMNVSVEPWDESLFNCSATDKGDREMREMALRFQGRSNFDEDYITINEAVDIYDITYINKGQSRVVIELPDDWVSADNNCIAKIQWDPNFQQNFAEFEIWKELNGRQAALVNPILDSGASKQWLIFPEAKMHTDLTVKQTSRIVKKLRRELRNLGIATTDLRRANVGKVMGRDVAIDYAGFQLK